MSPCSAILDEMTPAHGQAVQHKQRCENAKPRRMSLPVFVRPMSFADLSPAGSGGEDHVSPQDMPPTPSCYSLNIAINFCNPFCMETKDQMTPAHGQTIQHEECFARAKPRPLSVADLSPAGSSPASSSPFSLQDVPPTPYYYTSYNAVNVRNPFCMEPMRVTPTAVTRGRACIDRVQMTPDHLTRSTKYLALMDIPVTPSFDSMDVDLDSYSLMEQVQVSPALVESRLSDDSQIFSLPIKLKLTEAACGRLSRCSSEASSTNVSSTSFSESTTASSNEEVISPQSVEAFHTPPGVFRAPCRAGWDHGHCPEPRQIDKDWYCPMCCDVQFRNNEHCRMCGLQRQFGVLELKDLNPEMFLKGHNIAPAVAAEFRGLPPALQQVVMSGGSLNKARQPTAVLRTRICKAKAMSRAAGCESSCATLGFNKKQQKMKPPIGSTTKRR